MPGNHPKKQRLYNVLFRMVWGNISKIFQKHFKPTNLIQQIKNLLIYQRKYDRLYHVKVITYFHARVAQGWSTTLPRWGPRVRIPSRAFFIFSGSLYFQRFPLFFIFSPAPPSKAKLLLRSFQIPGNPALQKEFPARKMR